MTKRPQAGFTMLEFLIILGMVVILLIIFAVQLSNEYLPRARDAQRKADLQRIKIAFEDYYNDNGCYPEENVLNNCKSDEFDPYLQIIPCDPETKQPYYYEPDPDNQCAGYRLLTELHNENDPDIVSMPCLAPNNYGISVGQALVPEICEALPSPSPSAPVPSPSGSPVSSPPPVSPSPAASGGDGGETYAGPYACDPTGQCNVYTNPAANGCPSSYATLSECNAACLNPANYCER